ncbi:MAG TPA: tetratricopeptide repeat protein [Bryobacteraceae bacterium]|jgi:tetratricopeptide (TPR) repeat protein|nr:tetratricopeptide repeat protein [Bryobacteraceae bacterium]
MISLRRATIPFLVFLTLVSCRRDPNVAKKQYLESGNKYFDHGRYKNAAIQYQNAIKIDRKYGPAYYKLGMVYLQMKPPQAGTAIHHFRRAVELLEGNQAYQEEYIESVVQLAELDIQYLFKDKTVLESDVPHYCQVLFKRDPNSFDGFRLTGDLDFAKFGQAADAGPTVANKFLSDAMENYRKADSIKPGVPGVEMQMGVILVLQNHLAEAEPYFRKVIDKDKSSYRAIMRLYFLYMQEQKTSDAEQLLKEAIQNNPKSHEYMERLAYHYGALGRHDDMVNELAQIKAHAKDFDAVYQVVGDFYYRTGDNDSALREYREGTEKDPKHRATYQHDIIQVLLRQGKRAEAAEVNNEVLKENPKDADAKSLAATFLLDQGDVNSALTQLQAVVTSSPDNAVAHFQLGRAYLASNRPDGRESARQQFERAIQLQPNLIQPRLGLAELQVGHGEYEPALDSVQQILQRDPGNMNAKMIQSQALLGQKKFDVSGSLLKDMLKTNPSSPQIYYQMGTQALAEGKPKDAESDFQRAYELNPANSQNLMGVVSAEIAQGQADKAMALLQSEATKAPNRIDLAFLLGTTAKQQGKFQQAEAYFNKVLSGLDQKSKTRADLYMQLGDCYRMAGDLNSSIANYQKAREILPDNETVLGAMGVVLDQAGRSKEARQAYEACLRVNPNNAFILNNLAYLMAETNADLDVALNYAQKARGLSPGMGEITDTYGWILLKKGLAEQAIPVFQDLVSRVPTNSSYRFHLAKAYAQKGDNAKASGELREALKYSPSRGEQQEIQDMLSKLGGR